ncbi:SURF1 family protein [Roseateles sp. PN1]|uniref:SURF1 family protein n=1 Tax=Roseateles sp. PN1 TaxID=3137372 RepID=UPI00313A2834
MSQNPANSQHAGAEQPRAARPRWVVAILLLLAGLLCAGFFALGNWQLQRLSWKQALINRISQAQQAAPVPPPSAAQWAQWTPAQQQALEYHRVRLQGRFAHEQETLVRASTELGTGYWVLTPMAIELEGQPRGWVIVNRGYVGAEQVAPASRPAPKPTTESQTVIGLLRLTEPVGSLLQKNQPAQARWYSRDVAAIAQARGLSGDVAPFFVDAVAAPEQPEWPRAGLTVLSFKNNHLVYAITWFGLALMVLGAAAFLARTEWRLRQARHAY